MVFDLLEVGGVGVFFCWGSLVGGRVVGGGGFVVLGVLVFGGGEELVVLGDT